MYYQAVFTTVNGTQYLHKAIDVTNDEEIYLKPMTFEDALNDEIISESDGLGFVVSDSWVDKNL